MPIWIPEERWKGEDVFIIGGGNSLRYFNWDLLKPELTIGCNTAYTLGPQICKICIFEDTRFFAAHKTRLSTFPGFILTSREALKDCREPWLWRIDREYHGFSSSKIGWYESTGTSAIALAFLLGAKRVFLMGFDMKLIDGKSNWHDEVLNPDAVQPHVYVTFTGGFRRLVRDWHSMYSDREIVNLTKDSALSPDLIPWVNPDSFWSDREAKRNGCQN